MPTDDNETSKAPDQPAAPVYKLAVCVNNRYSANKPSCAARGSERLLDELQKAVKDKGLTFDIEPFLCFGRCTQGPTMRFIPGGDFRFNVKASDIPEIIRSIEEHYGDNAEKNEISLPAHLLGS